MRHSFFFSSIILLTVMLGQSSLAQVKPFSIAGHLIGAGKQLSFSITVSSDQDSTFIPITVSHGGKPGPVLLITAGVHGYEYPPILAAQQFAKQLKPAEMSGTIIIVHHANLPSFLRRSIAYNPQDGKNLNRVFPGRADGTITERLAWVLGSELIAKCDYMIDVHAGDAQNDLMPYAGYYNYYDKPELSEQGRKLAVALGFETIVQFGNEQSLKEASMYCSREAITRGIPAVDIECGRYGMAEPQFVNMILKALDNVSKSLRIVKGVSQPAIKHRYIENRTSIDSKHTGFFKSDNKAGQQVLKGSKIGQITDLFGNYLEDVISPVDGIILYMNATPPISKGENLFSIGHLSNTSL
ncbi:succinylglutamate desuccinylase/aspartoacylase family protein [Pedobacter quisquiliarum]|nr:M14 family metallopeptidase [Pedobacter quisquiliarum]